MSSIVFAIGANLFDLGVASSLEVARITNKIIVPAYTSGDSEQVINMGKTVRQFSITGRYIGTEKEINAFVNALNSAEYDPTVITGKSKLCRIWLRTNVYSYGTTTSTSANKLVDSSANFTIDEVEADMWAYNYDDTPLPSITPITAKDNAITLSLSEDAFVSGQRYSIYGERISCSVQSFNLSDNGGKPGYIDYNLILRESVPLL